MGASDHGVGEIAELVEFGLGRLDEVGGAVGLVTEIAELVEQYSLGAVHELHAERVVDHGDVCAGPVGEPESASRSDGADREACSFVEVRDDRAPEAIVSTQRCGLDGFSSWSPGMTPRRSTSPPSSDPTRRVIVDVAQVADELGANVSFARRLVWERRIPYFKIGKIVRFDLADVHDWLDRCRVDALR